MLPFLACFVWYLVSVYAATWLFGPEAEFPTMVGAVIGMIGIGVYLEFAED
jgi:hypothetical protein